MRLSGSILRLCLCTALVAGVGVSLNCPQAASEAGQKAETVAAPNIWVEAVFAELDGAATRHLEERMGFGLSPPGGKAVLTGEEKEKLLGAIREIDGARIIASLAVVTIGGQQAQSEDVEEVIYPTEYDVKEGRVVPGNWEKRDVGTILNVTPTVTKDGRIALVIMPEVTVLSGWNKIGGTDVSQPMFRTWNKTTTIGMPDGATLVLKESPIVPFHHGRVQAAQAELARKPVRLMPQPREEGLRLRRPDQYMKKRDSVSAKIARLESKRAKRASLQEQEKVVEKFVSEPVAPEGAERPHRATRPERIHARPGARSRLQPPKKPSPQRQVILNKRKTGAPQGLRPPRLRMPAPARRKILLTIISAKVVGGGEGH